MDSRPTIPERRAIRPQRTSSTRSFAAVHGELAAGQAEAKPEALDAVALAKEVTELRLENARLRSQLTAETIRRRSAERGI
jgi:hypothetical protein